jgi:hypothetical protein
MTLFDRRDWLSRAAVESPERVRSHFGISKSPAEKVPETDGADTSRTEAADSYAADMEAQHECNRDVCRMYKMTGSRMVNHAYATLSSEDRLGLVARL